MTRFARRSEPRSTLRLAARLAAPPATVFAAWLHPALVRHWLFATATRPLHAAHVDARPGGELVLRERPGPGCEGTYRGTFLRLAPPGTLAFTLVLPDAPGAVTRVEVGIEPAATGCRLSLAHALVPAGGRPAMEARWAGALYGLAETLAMLAEARSRRVPLDAG